jgi:hypothetical protein
MRKGGEDFMVHLLEASLLAFTIPPAQKKVCCLKLEILICGKYHGRN